MQKLAKTVCSIPDGSKKDPLQDTAESVSCPGGASEKMYLRKGKMVHGNFERQEEKGKKYEK